MSNNRHDIIIEPAKPMVSFGIPAYNNIEYTRKTIHHLLAQHYRPIEIILSDDCSPTPLTPLAEEVQANLDEGTTFSFHRQATNLFVGNHTYVATRARGKYLMLYPHDDWFTDMNFVQEAVDIMENHAECHLACGNSIEEGTGLSMLQVPDEVVKPGEWAVLEGDRYIRLLGSDAIGWQAYSAVIFNRKKALEMGAFQNPFFYTREESLRYFGIEFVDEGFVVQYLLSSIGKVALTGKIVSVRGRPPTSVCASNMDCWSKSVARSLFVTNANVYLADLSGKYAGAVKKRAAESVNFFPLNRPDVKILRHYGFSPAVVYLMFRSIVVGNGKKHLRRAGEIISGMRRRTFRENIEKILRTMSRGRMFRDHE